LAGRIRRDHKASQSRATQFQTKIERLFQAGQQRRLSLATCHDYSTCIARHRDRRTRRMDARHSQGQAPARECRSYPSSACQRARSEPLVKTARFAGRGDRPCGSALSFYPKFNLCSRTGQVGALPCGLLWFSFQIKSANSEGGIRDREQLARCESRTAQSNLGFWERGAQNRRKECHLVDARRQPSDELLQAVVQ